MFINNNNVTGRAAYVRGFLSQHVVPPASFSKSKNNKYLQNVSLQATPCESSVSVREREWPCSGISGIFLTCLYLLGNIWASCSASHYHNGITIQLKVVHPLIDWEIDIKSKSEEKLLKRTTKLRRSWTIFYEVWNLATFIYFR